MSAQNSSQLAIPPSGGPPNNDTETGPLNEAFKALECYDAGSPRGALLPIDEAVNQAAGDRKLAKAIQQRLITALRAGGPVPKREYICSKLGLIGTDDSVPALAQLLLHPDLVTYACDALEKIPGRAAARALRANLDRLPGRSRAAAIRSLGVRRDEASVKEIARRLDDPHVEVATRAAEALGEIGTAQCTKPLLEHLGAPVIQNAVADALLSCAENLARAGKAKAAHRLYSRVAESFVAPHIRQAALSGAER